jgi:hypothetical protein
MQGVICPRQLIVQLGNHAKPEVAAAAAAAAAAVVAAAA